MNGQQAELEACPMPYAVPIKPKMFNYVFKLSWHEKCESLTVERGKLWPIVIDSVANKVAGSITSTSIGIIQWNMITLIVGHMAPDDGSRQNNNFGSRRSS